MQLSKSDGLISLVRGAHRRTRRVRGDGLLKRVPRHRRSSASPACELGRSALRSGASVTTGTPAFQFVALEAPRLDSVQRHHWDLLRGVALRPVAFACRNSPRNTLQGVLSKCRRTARRKNVEAYSRAVCRPKSRIEVRRGVRVGSMAFTVGGGRHSADFLRARVFSAGGDGGRGTFGQVSWKRFREDGGSSQRVGKHAERWSRRSPRDIA